MKDNTIPVRFSTRIRQRTVKAEEIFKDQIEDAKRRSVAKEKRDRKDKEVSNSGILGSANASLVTSPGILSKVVTKDMKDVGEAEEAAEALRGQVSSLTASQNQAVNSEGAQVGEDGMLLSLSVNEDGGICWGDITEEELVEIENVHVQSEGFYGDYDGFLFLR